MGIEGGNSFNFVCHRKPWDITWIDHSWEAHILIRTICPCGGKEHRCDFGAMSDPHTNVPVCNCFGKCEECQRCLRCSNNNRFWIIDRGNNNVRWRRDANILRSIRSKGLARILQKCGFCKLWPCDELILKKIIDYASR